MIEPKINAELVVELEELLFQRLMIQIQARMAEHRRPHGCHDLAQELNAPAHVVALAMWDLAEAGKVAIVDRVFGSPLYRLVEAGHCEWCGLFNRQLTGGECPQCVGQLPNTTRPAAARRVC